MDKDGTTSYAGTTSISYSGTAWAYPIIKIVRSGGDGATLKSIINYTTGAELWFNFAMRDGEELIIDLRPGQRSMTSNFRGDITGEILQQSNAGAFYLTHGNASGGKTNTIYAFIVEDNSPTVTTTMWWRDAYASYD